MKLTKSQIRDIIMEELKNLENDQIEEAGRARKFVTGLGLAAATAFGTPNAAQAEKPSAASQISSFDKQGPKLPDLGDRYADDYAGQLEDKKTGERFLFKKEQNERGKTIIKLYKFLGGDKVDLDQEPIIMSAKDAEAKYDLKPGWIRKTSHSQIPPSQAFKIKENNMKITKSYLKQVIMEELQKESYGIDVGRYLWKPFEGETPQGKEEAIKNLQSNQEYYPYAVWMSRSFEGLKPNEQPYGIKKSDGGYKLYYPFGGSIGTVFSAEQIKQGMQDGSLNLSRDLLNKLGIK